MFILSDTTAVACRQLKVTHTTQHTMLQSWHMYIYEKYFVTFYKNLTVLCTAYSNLIKFPCTMWTFC